MASQGLNSLEHSPGYAGEWLVACPPIQGRSRQNLTALSREGLPRLMSEVEVTVSQGCLKENWSCADKTDKIVQLVF